MQDRAATDPERGKGMGVVSTAVAVKSIASAAKSLVGLSNQLAALIRRALATPDLQQRVLLYLRTVQQAVGALGTERQQILTDARRCSAQNARQIRALWTRMDSYLHEDHIRPQLQKAIDGLRGCNASISAEADKFSWRDTRNKVAAAKMFVDTLNELDGLLQQLTNNFYPGGSGIGVVTLVPIYELITRLHDDDHRKTRIDYNAANLELADLIRQALRDESHDKWVRYNGQVERLIAELHLAFNWTEDLRSAVRSAHKASGRVSDRRSRRRM